MYHVVAWPEKITLSGQTNSSDCLKVT